MQQSGFFDANKIGDTYDRVYLSSHFALYFASFVGNGVFAGKSDELQILAQSQPAMQVTLKPGQAWINGYWYQNTSDYVLNVPTSHGIMNRIDSVVIRWDILQREITALYKQGIPSDTPTAPELIRNSDYYELQLATISIKAGAINIKQADITDTRLNKSLCGWVTGTIPQIDTTTFFNQIQSAMNEFMGIVQSAIDGTAYGKLDSKITNLENSNEQFKQEIDSMFFSLSNSMAGQMNMINTQLTQTANEAKFVKTNPISIPISLWQTNIDSLNRSRYKFKANVPISGMKESYYVNVLFKDVDWVNENIAMEVYSKNGSVEIYSATVPDEPVEILNIVYWR